MFQGGRQPAYDYVRKIVRRMEAANKEAVEIVRDDRMFAFRTAKLSETWTAQTVPGTGVRLQSIHAMAHEAVGDAFGGSWIYAEGLKHLFGSELGREALLPFLELTVTIGAFVLFAPAGYALSAAFAAERYETAAGHEALAEGLIDPDAVMSRAEAELEMFMSHFEIALLVLPESGAIARRVFQGGRTLLRQGLRQGSRTVARQAAAHMLEELGAAMKGELLNAFIHQLATAKALEPILQLALAPVFAVLADEAAPARHPGRGGLVASLTPFQNAAGWTLTLKAAEPAGGAVGALGALAAAVPLPGPLAGTAEVVKLGHTMLRADVTVAKGIGLDGGRVKIVVEALPFRLIQEILGAYETAQDKPTASKAKGVLAGTLKLFWRVGLPYPGLAEAADLLQSELGIGDAEGDVAAEFVVTGLSVESEKVSYRLVIEGVDKAWHALGTERVAKPLALAKPVDS